MSEVRTYSPLTSLALSLIVSAIVSCLVAFQIVGISGNFVSVLIFSRSNEQLALLPVALVLVSPFAMTYWQLYRFGRWQKAIWAISTLPGFVIGAVLSLPVVWIWPLLSNEPPPGWFTGWLLSLGLSVLIASWISCRRPLASIYVAAIPLAFVLSGALTDYDSLREFVEFWKLVMLSLMQIALSGSVLLSSGRDGLHTNPWPMIRIPMLELPRSRASGSQAKARSYALAGGVILILLQSWTAVLLISAGLIANRNLDVARRIAKASIAIGGIVTIFELTAGVDGILAYGRLIILVVIPVVVSRHMQRAYPEALESLDAGQAQRLVDATTAQQDRFRRIEDLNRYR